MQPKNNLSPQVQMSSDDFEKLIRDAIKTNHIFSQQKINLTCVEGGVLISGVVPRWYDKQMAQETVKSCLNGHRGALKIINELKVEGFIPKKTS